MQEKIETDGTKELTKVNYKKKIVYNYTWTCLKCGNASLLSVSTSPTKTFEFICVCGEVLNKWDVLIIKK